VEISEVPENVVGDLTEASNLSSEDFINVSDPNPASEGKPRCIIQYFNLLQFYAYIYIYYILH
jgi:hypothetical protein